MKLSVIVPMLNERQELPVLLERLLSLKRQGCEVIIVDGGSTDTSAILAAGAGFRVIASERGRARQQNAGAATATGHVLLFLHADTQLPAGALSLIERALVRGSCCWGRFDVAISGRSIWLPMVAHLINWRSRLTGIATGDQAMFMRRDVFFHLGGFPEIPLMEDVALSKRLLEHSRPSCIRQRLTTSGRRWEQNGVWSTIFLMWRLRWSYWRGVPAEQLAKAYR